MNTLEIIDSHVHPPFSDGRNYHLFPESMPVETPEPFVKQLKQADISRCCGGVIFRPDGGDRFSRFSRMNQAALKFRHKAGDFYLPGLQLDLQDADKSCPEIEHYYHKEGFRWIGEIYFQSPVSGIFVSSTAFEIYDLAQKLSMPISVSCGRMDYAQNMCLSFPKLSFILSHVEMRTNDLGSWLNLIRETPNLYVDLAPSIVSRFGLIKKFVDTVASHKVIFGSGFPIRCPQSSIASYLAAGLNDSQLESIFGLNFKRITGLE